mmetsp:Transcript_2282/g.3572  ORF Transcript_2282/g.3572 Transcript_2282/m.3572 type:complete len:564 (-) Transcript_2282:78-1769(-)|eukprot:CAMPEP_0119012648 /NCGR_PEP_ID=MMETSP1176-20130426/7141_1 /TAXON_ID=265551 /ORGANISM="Synedropsis recta cf, Strain CCMP1620" /LENGTH=563 /DNA_ID=CAMNT_0006965647 /DNA_START=31 /DNA_END=1722 /DNA_ORIENTATION=+
MVTFCGMTLFGSKTPYDDGIDVVDKDAGNLSHVGMAAYEILRTNHNQHHHSLWNVTNGLVVGDLHQTPKGATFSSKDDPEEGHDDWFPEKMMEIMGRTEHWCDLLSLGPPDGIFMVKMKEAIAKIATNAQGKDKPVTVRIMFGNIVGMPVNCDKLLEEFTKDLPSDANLQMWVGAWRSGTSWNHAKIIAVDGTYLHTGGHNLWDPHYLKGNPVHDLSIELEGKVAMDGHMYANEQWDFIIDKQSTLLGQCAENLPDHLPLIWKNRIIVSEYPKSKAAEFPPKFAVNSVPAPDRGDLPQLTMITMGRLGAILKKDRPSDDAFVAMIDSATTMVRMSLQDLGPVCIPNTKMALPGLSWPKPYLSALARVIWTKGVDVEIILSNPASIPGGLGPMEACYGNGWTCVDVAAEIIKRIRTQFPEAQDSELRQKVSENLRICFVRHAKTTTYTDGGNIGLHSKFFMVDDVCSYTGSQNLYVCDLAEWGVMVDDVEQTQKMLQDYWNPMWQASYTGDDCNVQEVMDGLDVDRDGEEIGILDMANTSKYEEAARSGANHGAATEFYGGEEN